jgi:hypothetical protein
MLAPPLLSDDPSDLLDHLELRAIRDTDGNASAAELLTELAMAGSKDVRDEEAAPTTLSEELAAIVDAVFTHAEDRIVHCGDNGYPFEIDGNVLLKQDTDFSRVYTFLLLLSAHGKDAVSGMDGARLFEDVCAIAAASYLGSANVSTDAFIFGFPRRLKPKDFPGALKKLCNYLCEGKPDKKMPNSKTMKDAGLDVVVRKPFADGKASQLIAFGQCATGDNWWSKRYELQPGDWCREWMTKTPHVAPSKMFFVPHSVTSEDWVHLGYQAGIVFDRFRIAYCCENAVTPKLRKRLTAWSNAARSKTIAKRKVSTKGRKKSVRRRKKR